MKLIISLLIPFVLTVSGLSHAQTITTVDSTGLPGDNFSLEGALEIFKKAGSPEEFEKLLNTEDNKVNNLDLNEDGEIDYIRVIEKKDEEAHVFVMQAAVSETESQDIAVIELEKTSGENAVVQVIGDEDIYGETTIVEPTEEVKTNAGTTSTKVVVNVWAWPVVRYVYRPAYQGWVSPWGWRTRPVWWRPWRPVRHHLFYPYRAQYRNRYQVVHTHRVVHAHRIYAPGRTTSVTIHSKHQASVNRYRATRTTQKIEVSKGNNHVKTTRKTTTVKGKNGKVKSSKRTVKKKKN